MATKRVEGPVLLCWIAGVVTVLALVAAMVLRSGLEEVGRTSSEINSVVAQLESLSSIRGLVISLSEQCSYAQQSWISVLDTSLGMLFLVSLVAIALTATLAVQVKLNRKLSARLDKLQQR
ncbi:hypothetical protein [Motiliproteus coralliicola]|uniref:hypothetical protein n=1 Tax=Motiliproteus coralliicola TaxID=2283196 RepID=UPI000E091CD8|nr:hypothetical protein [Motiliproteus coralliicola]